MRRSTKKQKRVLLKMLTESGLIYAIALSLAGCSSALREDSFCATYLPVYTSEADTPETRAAVNENNAVWLALCLGENIHE